MAIHWEIFRGGETKRSSERLHVTLNRKHVLLLNRYTFGMMGSPEMVRMMFDSRQSLIGVAPTYESDPDGFRVKLKSNLNYIIHTAPFCRHHGILIETTERFVQPDLSSDGCLTLDLKQTAGAGTRRKRLPQAKKEAGSGE